MSESDSIIVDTTNRIFQDLGDPQTVNNAKDDGWKIGRVAVLQPQRGQASGNLGGIIAFGHGGQLSAPPLPCAVATRGQAVVGPYAPEPAGLPHCRRDCRPGPCDGRPVESST